VLGKGSGVDSVKEALEAMGVEADDATTQKILARVKSASLQKRDLLSDDEFSAIAESVLSEVPS
jgi:isopropylmalate/homocitrate/citramalate synthase